MCNLIIVQYWTSIFGHIHNRIKHSINKSEFTLIRNYTRSIRISDKRIHHFLEELVQPLYTYNIYININNNIFFLQKNFPPVIIVLLKCPEPDHSTYISRHETPWISFQLLHYPSPILLPPPIKCCTLHWHFILFMLFTKHIILMNFYRGYLRIYNYYKYNWLTNHFLNFFIIYNNVCD